MTIVLSTTSQYEQTVVRSPVDVEVLRISSTTRSSVSNVSVQEHGFGIALD